MAQDGDGEALKEICKGFTGLIVKNAKSIYVKGFDVNDLVQIGQVSLIKAVNMYDTDKGDGFITYAANSIKRNFYTLIRDNVKLASCCSINSVNNEGAEFIETIASEENFEEDFIEREEKILLSKAINRLSEKEKEIIHWFYFENRTLQEYIKFKGIAYRTAVDRKKKALMKLREMLEGMGY